MPVVVIGNITVGGAGKTPFVAWLAQGLKDAGFQPGIIMRGYGGQLKGTVQIVQRHSSPTQVGDEAVLLALKTDCPVVVGVARDEAASQLLATFPHVDVVLSDDGLQHYALRRDIEIAIVDGKRRLGNGYCLPAGPLRETPARLKKVDWVIATQVAQDNEWQMIRQLAPWACALNSLEKKQLSSWQNKIVHAVAAIAHPEAFFEQLQALGLQVIAHPFPDHYVFKAADFHFSENWPILMTEKDAVKCRALGLTQAWYVPLEINLPEAFLPCLLARLRKSKNG